MSEPKDLSSAVELAADEFLRMEFAEHAEVLSATARAVGGAFRAALDTIEVSVRNSGKVLFFGNGGSAADAQHIAAELVVRYKADRPAIAALALTTDTSALTACGNDFGFDSLFARQIEALGNRGDVAVGISTSGRSANVLAGLKVAKARGLRTVGLAGGSGGEMNKLCDALIVVPSAVTARVQEMHILIGHMLCKALEQRLHLV